MCIVVVASGGLWKCEQKERGRCVDGKMCMESGTGGTGGTG